MAYVSQHAQAVNSNHFQLYVVTRSYSSHLFLCALVPIIQAVGFVQIRLHAHKQLQKVWHYTSVHNSQESMFYMYIHYTTALVSFPGCSCIGLEMRQQQYVYFNLGRKQECVNWLGLLFRLYIN